LLFSDEVIRAVGNRPRIGIEHPYRKERHRGERL
jgi:hypothetical protein